METYITICKIDSHWGFAVRLRKLKQGLCINLEGWDGEQDWREVHEGGDICTPVADSCWGLTENSTVLWSNYPSIKNKLILKKITKKQVYRKSNKFKKKEEMEWMGDIGDISANAHEKNAFMAKFTRVPRLHLGDLKQPLNSTQTHLHWQKWQSIRERTWS